MQRTSKTKSFFWNWLLGLGMGLTLMAVSGLVGYASVIWWEKPAPNNAHHARRSLFDLFSPSGATSDAADESVQDPVSDYKTALALVRKYHYGATPNARKLTYEAIRGMLNSLRDPFTSFLDPDEWEQMQSTTKGDFEGIGALLRDDLDGIRVARPIVGSPAEKVGLKPNDLIVSVNGKSMKGKTTNAVIHLVKGRRGTKVLLGIQREKQQLQFLITRARVEPPIVQHWMEDETNKIGHIVLSEFNEKSMAQLTAAFRDLEKHNMRGLVFDLRYNPGGLLEVAIQVASGLIPTDANTDLHDVIVHIRENSGREQDRERESGSSLNRKRLPMVVLINENSASASEIVAGAMKDYSVATLMGVRTYGKGKVQTLFPLDDGSALRLTTAHYYPPRKRDIDFLHDEDGTRIPGTGGILPDITVTQSEKWKPEDFQDKANDTQLQKALTFLRAKLNGLTTAQATERIQQVP